MKPSKIEKQIQDLEERRSRASAMGGEAKIERQHSKGKLTARERVDLLVDPGTFQEYGLLASHHDQKPGDPITPADGLVAGTGRVDGRPVGLFAEDATVYGGSVSYVNFDKRLRIQQLCATELIPFIGMFDGAGARAQTLGSTAEGAPIFSHTLGWARLSGQVPTVSLVMGPCAGQSALDAGQMDYCIMVKGTGMLAAGGPPVVKTSTGIDVSKEELGGATVHGRITGMVDDVAADDAEAIRKARRFLSYLPASSWEFPPSVAPRDPGSPAEKLLSILPDSLRTPYDMKDIIACVLDAESFYETKPDYGAAIITGLGRLNGHSVGILASQPMVRAGAIGGSEGQKARKFIDLCAAHHLPLVSLTDTPGVMTGPDAEREGSLKHGLAAAYALAHSNVPFFSVILRKAFGFGGGLMAGHNAGQTLALAWPTADFSSLPPDAAIEAAHRDELDAADDRDALFKTLMKDYSALSGPYPAAGLLNIDDVISPAETRSRLIQALEVSLARRSKAPSPTERHGIMP